MLHKANDLQESHEGKPTAYVFPLKYCGHRWLGSEKTIKRLIDIQPYLKQYLECFSEIKKFPKKNDRFAFLKASYQFGFTPWHTKVSIVRN